MKYRVPLKITFSGCALIEANSEEEAEDYAVCNVLGCLGNVSGNLSDKVIDWEFDLAGYTELRDNESIEEIEENEEKE